MPLAAAAGVVRGCAAMAPRFRPNCACAVAERVFRLIGVSQRRRQGGGRRRVAFDGESHVYRLLGIVLLGFSVSAAALKPVDTRLAVLVETALQQASGIDSIELADSDPHSIIIRKVNSADICDPRLAGHARELQEVLNRQPGIHENKGPAFHSVTHADGRRELRAPQRQRDGKPAAVCVGIYVSVGT